MYGVITWVYVVVGLVTYIGLHVLADYVSSM